MCPRQKVSLDERLNAARQVRHKIYKNALNDLQLLMLRNRVASQLCRSHFLPVKNIGAAAHNSFDLFFVSLRTSSIRN